MKRLMGLTSFYLFLIGLSAYITSLFGHDQFLFSAAIASIIGIVLGMFAEKGVYKRIGLVGNGLIILLALIIPFFVTTFFWNQP